jgi:hypothetical protein
MQKSLKVVSAAIAEGISVTQSGKVIGIRGKILKPIRNSTRNKSVYHRISFYFDGVNHKIPVHKLVAYLKFGRAAFVDKVETRHKDNNSTNNRWSNILIGSHQDNMLDIPAAVRRQISAYALGKSSKTRRKLTNRQVRKMRKLYEEGIEQPVLEEAYGISHCACSYILNYKTYRDVL